MRKIQDISDELDHIMDTLKVDRMGRTNGEESLFEISFQKKDGGNTFVYFLNEDNCRRSFAFEMKKIDIEEEQELANDFNVRSIPLLMVIKEGVVVFSESGILPAAGLRDLITQGKNLDMSAVHKEIDQREDNK